MSSFCCPAAMMLLGIIIGGIGLYAWINFPRPPRKGKVIARTEAQEAEMHMVNPGKRRVIVKTDEDEWAREQNEDWPTGG